jgi:hypothetical protein
LALGLKKETADMCYRYVNTVKGEKKYELIVEAAWSQEVIDEYVRFGTKIGLFDNLVHPCGKPVTPLEARADVTKNDIPAWSLHRLIEMRLNEEYSCRFNLSKGEDAFEKVIRHIEFHIKEGYFNKEYLDGND